MILMSLGFFEKVVVGGYQIVASCKLGGGNVERIKTSDGKILNQSGSVGDGVGHWNVKACIFGHRKSVGALNGIRIAEKFLNQIIAGDDGETSCPRFLQDPFHSFRFQSDTDL